MIRTGHSLRFTLAALAVAIGVAGCAQDRETSTSQNSGLKREIAEVKGTYTWRADLKRFEYSDRARLEEILSTEPRETAMNDLIGCLDDTSSSASTIDHKPVALGIVCYEALTQLVYYEPTAPDGDVATEWIGLLSPRASPPEMREAKAAWKKAADAKLIILQ